MDSGGQASESLQPLWRYRWRIAISLGIAVALTWTLWRGGLPIVPNARAFEHMSWWTLPIYGLCLGGMHYFRAARWRHLLKPLGDVSTRHVLATAFIGFAAVMFIPLRAGEVVRPVLLGKRGTIRGWQAAGTVAGERVIDGLVLSAVLFAALQLTTPVSPLPDHVGELQLDVAAVPVVAYSALALFACCFAAMFIFYFKRSWGVAITRAAIGWASPKLAERVAAVVDGVTSGLGFLPKLRSMAPFALETGCYWALNAGGLWLLAQGCGLDTIGLGQACVVMGCLGIGILVPSGPGYFGTFQLSVYLALAMFVEPSNVAQQGSAFVFISYSAQVVLHLLGGLVGVVLNRTENLADDQDVA